MDKILFAFHVCRWHIPSCVTAVSGTAPKYDLGFCFPTGENRIILCMYLVEKEGGTVDSPTF